jgi:hypothetical protein
VTSLSAPRDDGAPAAMLVGSSFNGRVVTFGDALLLGSKISWLLLICVGAAKNSLRVE